MGSAVGGYRSPVPRSHPTSTRSAFRMTRESVVAKRVTISSGACVSRRSLREDFFLTMDVVAAHRRADDRASQSSPEKTNLCLNANGAGWGEYHSS